MSDQEDFDSFDLSYHYDGDDPVIQALWTEIHTVIDPEIGLPLVDLGLIYNIEYKAEEKLAHVLMSFTSIGCPAGAYLKSEVYKSATRVEGVEEADVEVTFNPQWNPREMASEEVQMMLGIF